MNQERFNKLREKIIEAVPDILKLEFGCEILVKTKKINIQKAKITGLMSNGNFECWEFGEINQTNIYKILGRPITLEDVLSALEKTNREAFNAEEQEEKILISQELAMILYVWKRGKSFDEQSEETKLALCEIFNV